MTDDDPKPKFLQPERIVALIRKRAETYETRLAANQRKHAKAFAGREDRDVLELLAKGQEKDQAAALAMLRAVGINVPRLALSDGPVGIADASPESKPVIDSEFAETAEADEDGRTVYEHVDSELKARDLELTVGEGQTISMPAWALQEPPVTSKPIEIDRTLSKGRAR